MTMDPELKQDYEKVMDEFQKSNQILKNVQQYGEKISSTGFSDEIVEDSKYNYNSYLRNSRYFDQKWYWVRFEGYQRC